jgi:hypothetical protein
LATGEMERIVRQGPLGFVQETCEVFGQFDEQSLTASKTSVRAMIMKSHGGYSHTRINGKPTQGSDSLPPLYTIPSVSWDDTLGVL